MFYLLFQYNSGSQNRDYRGFRKKEELTKFLFENSKKILTHKIIESEKEYEFRLIRIQEKEKAELIETEELDKGVQKEEAEVLDKEKELKKKELEIKKQVLVIKENS